MSKVSQHGSFGTCQACGTRKNKTAMVGHLKTCFAAPPRASGAGHPDILLLRAQANHMPPFWLYVAVRSDARLTDLDRCLRRIWLECCGHLSEFSGPSHQTISMNTLVGTAVGVAGRLGYVYDFGSSTELTLNGTGVIEGPIKNKVQLAARNEPPTWPCDACGKPATSICVQCVYEDRGLCCSAHGSRHECGDEMLLPVVNSPRMGVCGYTGEA